MSRLIQLRKVEVHNLKGIDLDLPRGKLVVFCGLSGSGKSSLAFDTLYAEGQRRYIESFSAYTRQFLERLEKPQAEKIEGLPPSIAVAAKNAGRSTRSTVGTVTEANDYLRLLFARIARLFCHGCGREVLRDSPQSVADAIAKLPSGLRFMIAVPHSLDTGETLPERLAAMREDGFTRLLLRGRVVNLGQDFQPSGDDLSEKSFDVLVDRLKTGDSTTQRVRDSLETAFAAGDGRCVLYVEESASVNDGAAGEPNAAATASVREGGVAAILGGHAVVVDDAAWRRVGYVNRLSCEGCGLTYPEPEPRLFSFNSPLGACPECEGFGNVIDIDMDLVVPDPQKSIKEGAVAPWNSPAYEHELKELLALAKDYHLPVDVPFRKLTAEQLKLVVDGVPERSFGGLKGFFAWLEKKKYKMHIRVFLSRWRSYRECPSCKGARLRPDALAWRIAGENIAQILSHKTSVAAAFLRDMKLSDYERAVGRTMLDQVQSRLGYLEQVGLGYLTLDRTIRTLSGGEMQRVTLTSTLGSGLVNMLYVLDEPSAGLHPQDTDRLVDAVKRLRDRGNSVVVVEHEEGMIRAADQVVEIGPGAGRNGGKVVFQGTPDAMQATVGNMTGDFLAGRRGASIPSLRRKPEHGWVRLTNAHGNNLKNLTVEFPLGVLCVVTGVSGSGKSTLVQDTLYPALCRRMHIEADRPAPFDDVLGDGQLDDVVLVDQSPIGRSPRSNPVTYVKAFDEIRAVFAETPEAKTRNYTAGYFSFNVEGGRCERCEGDGYLEVDMQFLADVFMKCPECRGKRYRKEILDVKFRGASIADVLEMTIREAFVFFRGSAKVQARLKKLMDVGLDYLQLGQPANTLSGGESQRLKLAGYMAAARKGRALFILDEPTSGLHFADVVQLMDCFDALLSVGHSLIVVEHNMTIIKGADYIIDLGPGAADEGGKVVAKGSPEHVARVPESATGRVLATPIGETDAANLDGLKITGRVEGPKCRYSHTLPARIPVRLRGVRTSDGRAEIVGEAIVPDPNFWTPEMPFLYRAIVEVRRGDEIVSAYEQDFGIRPLGVRGKQLVFGGKTWVPRAVRREAVVGAAPLELWRGTATVMVVDDPNDELCREASEVGVVLFARVTSQESLRDGLRRFRQYAAVAVVLCDPARTMDERISRDESRNLLLAQDGSAGPLLEMGRPTLQACAIDFSQFRVRFCDAFFAEVGAAIRVPLLAQRFVESCTLIEARAACDALQADLAGKCDPAGYIV